MKIVDKLKKLVVLTLIGALGLSNSALAIASYPKLSGQYQKSSMNLQKLDLGVKGNLPITNPQADSPKYVQGEILVKFKNAYTKSDSLFKSLGLTAQEKNQLGYYRVKLKNSENFNETLDKLKENPSVLVAQPNYLFFSTATFNDSRLSYQWGLNKIKATQGWNISKGNPNIVVAIVDTGVDINHPEFKGRVVKGFNAGSPLYSPRDDMGHGTHVAGIVAAAANNGIGIAGLAPNVKIMPVKVLGSTGYGDVFNIAEGIKWAADHGAHVINLSLGGFSNSQVLDEAVQYAHNEGVVIVAAAGNNGGESISYPAAYANVLSINASNKNNELAKFSSYSEYSDVIAPGEEIYSTLWHPIKGSTYTYASGTSMASPFVAGLAALILSTNPKLKPLEVHQIIEASAADLGDKDWDKKFGYGLIDVEKALNMAKKFVPVTDQNEKIEQAKAVESGKEIVGKLNTAYDEDWYAISLSEPGALDIKGIVTQNQDIVMEIFDETEEKVTMLNSGRKGNNERTTIYELEAGKYFIKVREAANHWSNDDYKVTFAAIPEDKLIVDKNEPNNDEEEATVLQLNSELSGEIKGVINEAEDNDIFKITLKKGEKVKFKLSPVEGIDSTITTKTIKPDEENQEEEEDEDYYMDSYEDYDNYYDSNPTGQGEEGIITAQADGEILINIADNKENTVNEEYTLTIEKYTSVDGPVAVDPYEPNNTPEKGTPLELGKKLEGANLSKVTGTTPENEEEGKDEEEKDEVDSIDYDWYVLEVKEMGLINVKVDISELMPLNIRIYDERILDEDEYASPIGYISNGYEGKEVKGSFKALPGKYYIRVSGYDMLEPADKSYNITAEWSAGDFDQYEINDTVEQATPIELDTLIEGNLYPDPDIDIYEISLPANKNYQIELQPAAGQDTLIEIAREEQMDWPDEMKEDDDIWYDTVASIDNGKEGQLDAGVFRTTNLNGSMFYNEDEEGEEEFTRYLIGIIDKNSSYYTGQTGKEQTKAPYKLKISEYTAKKDKWENNDVFKNAKAIKLNEEIKPTFLEADDVDWFKVTIPKAGSLEVNLTTPNDLDGVLEICTDKGKLITRRDEVYLGDSEILKVNVKPGTYYIKAYEGMGNGSLATYSLKTRFPK